MIISFQIYRLSGRAGWKRSKVLAQCCCWLATYAALNMKIAPWTPAYRKWRWITQTTHSTPHGVQREYDKTGRSFQILIICVFAIFVYGNVFDAFFIVMLVLFKQTINKVDIKTRNLLMIKKVANPSQKEATQVHIKVY